MVHDIDHVVLNVSDPEVSVRWYGEHLGLQPERLEQWRRGEVPFVSLRVNEGTIIDLATLPRSGENADHVAFVVDRAHFDAFVADPPVPIELGPMRLFGARGTGEGLYVRDPDGNKVELRVYGDRQDAAR
jgi:catechol 2,3-dioxygenase-like lactoylglutathione lyase family enzyme